MSPSNDLSEIHQTRSQFVGVGLAIGGTFLFALKSILIKLAFGEGANPTQLLALRMLLAAPFYVIVWIYLWRRPKAKPIPSGTVAKALLLGFLGYYLASYLDLAGLVYISAQLERLTLFTYPTMVAVLAWLFLGEAFGWRITAALLLTYAGLALMYFQERALVVSADTARGVWLVLGSAASYSLYVLFAKPTIQKIGSREFTSLAMLGSTVFVGIHFLATQPIEHLIASPAILYVYGIVLAFVCTVIPSYMISESIIRIGATRTTVIGTVGPVLTMVLAICVLDEPSSRVHVAGMLLAIGGVSLVRKK